MTIKLWPESERPRERLIKHGAKVLSDAELLAIFFRTGVAGHSAVNLARQCIGRFGGLRQLLEASEQELCQTKGLGQAKYVQLQAVLEIARRYFEATLSPGETLPSSASVKRYLSSQLRHRRAEVFSALFLDSQQQLIAYKELFFGTVNAAAVYPREVVKMALDLNCSSIIFAHNHPSGIAEPSEADKHITQRLQAALQLVDIDTLDHVVVGDGDTVSFAERGWL